ncbi:MAG TPA: hypothetical protein VF463_19905 [Sphingobium sp.]
MTWACHSIHASSVRLINGGMSHDGKTYIPLPEPIHTAETEVDAESWRLGRLEEWKGVGA